MNVKLLRKVKKHILEEPKRFLMRYWLAKQAIGNTLPSNHAGFAKCGTAGCIAGWAWSLKHPRAPFPGSWEVAALLGIDREDRFRLFDKDRWPQQFIKNFKDDGSRQSAKIAAARIEHFIKTKGRE